MAITSSGEFYYYGFHNGKMYLNSMGGATDVRNWHLIIRIDDGN